MTRQIYLGVIQDHSHQWQDRYLRMNLIEKCHDILGSGNMCLLR